MLAACTGLLFIALLAVLIDRRFTAVTAAAAAVVPDAAASAVLVRHCLLALALPVAAAVAGRLLELNALLRVGAAVLLPGVRSGCAAAAVAVRAVVVVVAVALLVRMPPEAAGLGVLVLRFMVPDANIPRPDAILDSEGRRVGTAAAVDAAGAGAAVVFTFTAGRLLRTEPGVFAGNAAVKDPIRLTDGVVAGTASRWTAAVAGRCRGCARADKRLVCATAAAGAGAACGAPGCALTGRGSVSVTYVRSPVPVALVTTSFATGGAAFSSVELLTPPATIFRFVGATRAFPPLTLQSTLQIQVKHL